MKSFYFKLRSGIYQNLKNNNSASIRLLAEKVKSFLNNRGNAKTRQQLKNSEVSYDIYFSSLRPAFQVPANIHTVVIIPVYKGIEETKQCILSVIHSKNKSDFSILIINDCSPDVGMQETLKEINLKYPNLTTIKTNNENLGFVKTVNKGLNLSQGNDVILLNSDTVVTTHFVDRLKAHAYSKKNIGTVMPFSNNATIYSWPMIPGCDLPIDSSIEDVDNAFYVANRGHNIEIPTAVGFCMYITAKCIEKVGILNDQRFGKGYGEECDFCMRVIAKGLINTLACDLFVYHKGEVSFGSNSIHREGSNEIIDYLYPHYTGLVAKFLSSKKDNPYRASAAFELIKNSGKNITLIVTHSLGGGVQKFIDNYVCQRSSFFYILSPCNGGYKLSFPSLKGIEPVQIQEEHILSILKELNITRISIQHLLGIKVNHLRYLIRELSIPFDFYVHDYLTVCPRINLISTLTGHYCSLPSQEECNRCIINDNSFINKSIETWRIEYSWVLKDAELIICPSHDTKNKISKFTSNKLVVNYPEEQPKEWEIAPSRVCKSKIIRIGLLGVLSQHKGRKIVQEVLRNISSNQIEIVLIGYADPPVNLKSRGHLFKVTGKYADEELKDLIRKQNLDIIWLSSICPETYSYTLSSAIESNLPIMYADIGAFKERLQGRPYSYKYNHTFNANEIINLISDVKEDLIHNTRGITASCKDCSSNTLDVNDLPIPKVEKFQNIYIALIPEVFPNNVITPCGFIRLVKPFEEITKLEAHIKSTIECYKHIDFNFYDCIVCHRYSIPTLKDAKEFIRQAHANSCKIIYDIDDNLIDAISEHDEGHLNLKRIELVTYMILKADQVWVSTASLKSRIIHLNSNTIIAKNHFTAWSKEPIQLPIYTKKPIQIGYMGTKTHTAELIFLEPIIDILKRKYQNKIEFNVIGITDRHLPANVSEVCFPQGIPFWDYPIFMQWYSKCYWDIGVAPLVESKFNKSKSLIKLYDYANNNLAIVASQCEAYEEELGRLAKKLVVPNNTQAWVERLSFLIDHREYRQALANETRQEFESLDSMSKNTLARIQYINHLMIG